jgi:uncharacterized protein (TIGR02246 family)
MKEIESLFETYKNAVFQKDAEAFVSIFDDDVRIFDLWEWTYDGVTPWREMAKGWFGSLGTTERVVVTFDDIQIQGTEEMAIATAFVRFAAVSEKGEELRYLQNRLTWVAKKKEGIWKIIHEHTSGPVDGETMKVRLRRTV